MRMLEVRRESDIITEVNLGVVGVVLGWGAAMALGVVFVVGGGVGVVGGLFAVLLVGVDFVGEGKLTVVLLSLSGGLLWSLSHLLGLASFRRLPYRSQMGRGRGRDRGLLSLLWAWLVVLLSSGSLLLSLASAWSTLLGVGGGLGVASWDCQSKKLMIGEGVGLAACSCHRVGLDEIGRGDISFAGVVVVGGLVGEVGGGVKAS